MSRIHRSPYPMVRLLLIAVPALLLLGSCASSGPAPVDQIATSKATMAQAQRSGAQEYAAVELLAARDKLDRADEAMRAGRNDDARRLAEESEADALLAEAKARTAQSQKAVKEVQQAIETLRAELERSSR